MIENSLSNQTKKKVLFLCYGYSIHALRRIKIFTEDTDFDVTVVSTYNYNFANALNIHLKTPFYDHTQTAPGTKSSTPTSSEKKSLFSSIHQTLIKFPKIFNFLLLLYDILLFIIHLWKLKKTVKRVRPDVIFLQTLLYPSYLSYFLTRKIPIIITFWNGDITWWAKWNGIERFFKKKIVSYGIKRATAITVNSQTSFNICLSYGIDVQKINLIRYPGIDLSVLKQTEKALARKELGISAKKVVLCPRGFKTENDFLNNDIILEAAKNVLLHDKDICFLFVGINIGEAWNEFYNLPENLEFASNFRNDGSVEWNKMPIYYSAADVVISISSNDSQPNCMLEAMACKTLLIMGDIPQIREWIEDSKNGFIVPCRDSNKLAATILNVLNMDNALLNPIIENGYITVLEKAESVKNANLVKDLVMNISKTISK